MIKCICDCCGKEIAGGIGYAEIIVKKNAGVNKETFHLHETCANTSKFKLIAFFEGIKGGK